MLKKQYGKHVYFFITLMYSTAACEDIDNPYRIYRAIDSISSPLYPEYYPTRQRCKWIANAPPGSKIALNITEFHLGPTDYIEVRDKKDSKLKTFRSEPRLGVLWTFNRQSLIVYFESAEHFTFKGFYIKLKYSSYNTGRYL